jgi:hypothetical protein
MEETSTSEVSITATSHPRATAWANDLCGRFRDALGGVHLGTLEAHASLGHLAIARGRGQFLGCLVSKPRLASDPRIFPIIAAAVPSDLQRLKVGLTLLDHLRTVHALEPSRVFQACCRADLPSNHFWAAAGFVPCFVRSTNSARGKPIIVWRRRVDGGTTGVEGYIAPRKPRGGGGRWVPNAQPELAEVVKSDPQSIATALSLAGLLLQARPSGPLFPTTAVALPEVQGRLFPTNGRQALIDGR